MIDYQAQPITIQTREGEQSFEAMVAVGTGLAYHRSYARNGKFLKTYTVTHLASGYTIRKGQCPSAECAKRYIELLLPLIDWNQSIEAIQALPREKMNRLTSSAFRQAIQEAELVENETGV